MKIAITADLHAHDYTSFARTLPNGMNSRLMRCAVALCQISTQCIGKKIDEFWHLGDLFHARTKIDTAVYDTIYRTINTTMVFNTIRLLTGTHDLYLKDGSINSLRPFSNKANIYAKPEAFSVSSNVGVGALPYMKDYEKIRQHVEELLKQLERYDHKVLISHLGVVEGAMDGGYRSRNELPLENLCPGKWDLVLLGHYHRRQQLAPNVWYIGAPIQQDFGDEGNEDGFMVLDTDTLELEAVPIVSERFVTVKSMGEVGDHPGGYFVRLEGKEKGESTEKVHGLVCTSPEVPSFAPRIRLSGKMTMEEMMAKYVDHLGPELDRGRLMEVGKELVKGEE